jgi:hypothetical protein
MKHRLLIAAFIASGLVAPAVAQDFSPEGIIAQGDKDGDKAINKEEWGTMGIPYPFPEQGDANKDGKIDVPEMTILVAQFQAGGPPPPPPSPPAQAPAAPTPPQ